MPTLGRSRRTSETSETAQARRGIVNQPVPPNPPSGGLFDLSGRVVLVTGSTKGIGRAMVEGCARAGATGVVSSRKQTLCDQVAAEITATTGKTAIGVACHVGEWDAIPAIVRSVVSGLARSTC